LFPDFSKKILIVCLSSTRWDFLWQRPQQIMSRLADSYSVLYVDPPFPVAKEKAVVALSGSLRLRVINERLSVLEPVKIAVSAGIPTERLQSINLDLVIKQILQAISSSDQKKRLLWIYNPYMVDLVGHLDEEAVIYDCVDSFESFSWSSKSIKQKEERLNRKADVVITTAMGLYKERKKENPRTYLVPNGTDYKHFSREMKSLPADIASISEPRVGFTGALYEWVDFELIEYLAERHPDWNIVLIGPKQHGQAILEKSNVFWLGVKEYKVLPQYLQAFDIAIIPFKLNKTTIHTNPIKLWEYLSVGKPVVSTLLPEVPAISDVIWLSTDYREFELNCKRALERISDRQMKELISLKARAIAKQNSWGERCCRINNILTEHFRKWRIEV